MIQELESTGLKIFSDIPEWKEAIKLDEDPSRIIRHLRAAIPP